jgi:hypothetical protein
MVAPSPCQDSMPDEVIALGLYFVSGGQSTDGGG